jgi:hypothetical protein
MFEAASSTLRPLAYERQAKYVPMRRCGVVFWQLVAHKQRFALIGKVYCWVAFALGIRNVLRKRLKAKALGFDSMPMRTPRHPYTNGFTPVEPLPHLACLCGACMIANGAEGRDVAVLVWHPLCSP